jgi:hypothetical protein
MHAAVVTANIPGGATDARVANLKKNIVPMVSSAPGFVAGYWLEPLGDKGLSVVIFKDEAAAKAAAPPPGTDMGEGVTIESVEFRAVLGNA